MIKRKLYYGLAIIVIGLYALFNIKSPIINSQANILLNIINILVITIGIMITCYGIWGKNKK